jgi:hypothetical protein
MAGGLFFCPNQHDHRTTKQASCTFGPRQREAAKGGHSRTKSPKFIDRPADDDRTNERVEKYGDPAASNHVASSGAVDRTNKLTEKYADPSESNHVASNDAEYSTDYSRDL